MRSVRVIINSAKERSRSILADLLHQQMAATRMLVKESPYIVNEARYDDQRASLRLLLDYDVR